MKAYCQDCNWDGPFDHRRRVTLKCPDCGAAMKLVPESDAEQKLAIEITERLTGND